MVKRKIDVNKNIIKEKLEQYARYLTVYRNCILCDSDDCGIWARYGSYRAVKCKRCGLIWINPSLSEEGLNRYYQDYIGMRFKDKVKTRQRKIQYQIDKEFIESWISSGRILDVGCSGGFFLDVLSESFEKHGIDIDQEAVNYARQNFGFGNNINCIKVEEVTYPESYFDLIIMRGTIEHLLNPKLAVSKVAFLLKPKGYFCIAATPNVNSFCADLYREKWNQFHPVRHIFYFSAETLSKLCSPFNLKLIGRYYPYEETPYANLENDHKEVLRAWQLKRQGKFDKVGRSPAFWGNMMNLVFKKL